MCKGTFSTGFSGLVNEPAKPSKFVGHSIETISTGVALCSYGYCRNHVGTMNGAISGILGARHGMAERDAVRQNRRLPPRMGTEFGCKTVVQTLEGRLDEAEIAANFGLQKRCQG